MNTDIKYFQLKHLSLKDHKVSIKFANDLLQNLLPEHKVKILAKDNLPIFNITYPPFLFQESDNHYLLVARHWSYSFLISQQPEHMTFIAFTDMSLISHIIDRDKIECQLLHKVDSVIKKMSSATGARIKALAAKRICPKCHYPLVFCKFEQDPDAKGMYSIGCFNLSNHRCDFKTKLSKFEYDLFLVYKLPTTDWLMPITDKKCPKCSGFLFNRMLRDSPSNTSRFAVCQNKLSNVPTCTYVARITK